MPVLKKLNLRKKPVRLQTTLAKLPTVALILTRKALLESSTNTLEEQLDLEKKFQHKAGHTRDFMEGVTAFLQKRAPCIYGRVNNYQIYKAAASLVSAMIIFIGNTGVLAAIH